MTSRIGKLLLLALSTGTVTAQDDAASLGKRATQLVQQGKFAEALPVLDRWIAAAPKTAHTFILRAWIKNRLNDFDGAIADATRAIELGSRDARSLGERAFARFQKGDTKAALVDYDLAIALDPTLAHLHGERGDLLSATKDHAKAIAAYDKAIGLRPDWAEALTGRGEAARALADFVAARRDFVRATELSPDDAPVWQLRAGAEFDCRDDQAALRSAAEFVRRVPKPYRGPALALHGRLAWRIGDTALAVELLEDAAEQDQPGAARADALLSLGCVNLGAGNVAAARAAFAKASECDAPDLSVWVALMTWCVDAREHGLDAAASRSATRHDAKAGKLDDLQRDLVALCERGEGDDGAAALADGKPFDACPRAFFAAWRARCAGDDERADRLLLRCVNTGQRAWMQWATAVWLLRSRPSGKTLQPSLGAELDFVTREGATVGVVRGVLPGSAAECQGLAAGDQLVDLAGRPITRERWRELDERAREGLDLRVLRRRDTKDEIVWLRLGFAPR